MSTTHQTRPVHLEAGELQEWLSSSGAPRLLDVRTPAEFEACHIPGAYNVPLDTLREHREDLLRHVDDAVVLVCRSGMRAEQAEQALAEIGMPNLHVLTGGMNGWEAIGAPTNRGRRRWDLERQVRFVAGAVVLAAGLGSVAMPSLKWVATAMGAGLTLAALTDSCALGAILSRLPFNRAAASCDIASVLAELRPDDRTA